MISEFFYVRAFLSAYPGPSPFDGGPTTGFFRYVLQLCHNCRRPFVALASESHVGDAGSKGSDSLEET